MLILINITDSGIEIGQYCVNWWYVIVLIIYLVIYVYELFRYKNLTDKARTTPYISSISLQGDVKETFDSEHADDLLFSHISQINELYNRTLQTTQSLYGEISEIRDIIYLPHTWRKSPEYNFEQKSPLKIGPIEFYIKDIINLIFWVFHFRNPYVKKFYKLQFHINLSSIGNEIQVIVSRPLLPKYSGQENINTGDEGAALTELFEIVNDKSLTFISRMLWDSAFMIFQLQYGNSIPGYNWNGMKFFTEGLVELESYSNTADSKKLDEAIKSFGNATKSSFENYDILYCQAYLLISNRTKHSIDNAFLILTKALKSKDHWLKALTYVAFANCFAQQVHRLGKELPILDIASKHLEKGMEQLNLIQNSNDYLISKGKLNYVKAKIHSAEGLIDLLKAKYVKETSEKCEMYLSSASKYKEAYDISGLNTNYLNVIAYNFLKLAESDVIIEKSKDDLIKELLEILEKDKLIDEEKDEKLDNRNPVKISEKFFLAALKVDPTNKLVYANLCLLYSTPWCLKNDISKYLDLCRYYGHKVTRIWPEYINGHFDFIESLIKHDELEEAREVYDELMGMDVVNELRTEVKLGNDREIQEESIQKILNDFIKKS